MLYTYLVVSHAQRFSLGIRHTINLDLFSRVICIHMVEQTLVYAVTCHTFYLDDESVPLLFFNLPVAKLII